MRLLLLVLCLGMSAVVQAEMFDAKVIAVMDGDTVLILRGGGTAKVRMINIDAPEKDQPFGQQSRESLLEMVGQQVVQIDSRAADQYGRIIGQLSVAGRDVNQEQVRRGMAWEYSHYHSDKTYLGLQREAQQAKRGLWAQADPQAPWEWRKLHPSSKPGETNPPVVAPPAAPAVPDGMACGKKHRCSEMRSCDEVKFYFKRCNLKPLDGNRDGEPCEHLCNGKK